MTAPRPRIDPRWAAAAGSLLLSLIAILTDDIINDDGILYVTAAEWWMRGEWRIAFEHYRWPAYPLLLAGLSPLTGLSPELAARWVSAFSLAALSYAFVALATEIGARAGAANREHIPLFAALTILALPFFGESRAELLRDHAYWALYLCSLLWFHRLLWTPTHRHAWGWGGCMLAASMFRVEGIAILLLFPLLPLLRRGWSWRERGRALLLAGAPVALAAATILILLLLSPGLSENTGRLFEPFERTRALFTALGELFDRRAAPLREILAPYATEFAIPGLLAILVMILAKAFFSVLSPLFTGLLLLRPLHADLPRGVPAALLLWGAAAVNLLILFVFASQEFYLQTRFGFPLAVLPMLLVPFLLAAAEQRWKQGEGWERRIFPAALGLMVVALAAGMISTAPGHRYVREAAEWIAGQLPPRSPVLTNSPALAYYANHDLPWGDRRPFTTEKMLTPRPGYLAVQASRGRFPAWSEGLTPLAQFENRRHDGVRIYLLPDSFKQEAKP